MVTINSLRRTLILCVFVFSVNCEIKITNYESENVRCYPSRFELDTYYKSLSKLAFYFWENRSIIDITVYIGLFVTRVHLRSAFQLCDIAVYNHTEVDLFELITNFSKSIDYFAAEYIKSYKSKDKNQLLFYDILELFLEDGTWYNDNLQITLNPTKIFDITHYDFEDYVKSVYNFDEIEPSYHYLSKCLGHLSHTSYQFPTGNKRCPLSWICHTFFKPNPEGAENLGFSLTNKVGFLLMAKYSRSCRVTPFSEQLLDKFCEKMYIEAILNYKNKLPLLDLMAEQMAVCSLHRKGNMLFKDWLNIMLKHQVPLGCLKGNNISREYHSDKLDLYGVSKFNPLGSLADYGGRYCDRHLTTTFMVALSGAFRYIYSMPDVRQTDLCRFYFEKIYTKND